MSQFEPLLTGRPRNILPRSFTSPKLKSIPPSGSYREDQNVLGVLKYLYQLFFVPEAEYYKTIQSLPQGGSNPSPEQFSGRILLGEGREKKTGLERLKERTISLTGVPFKLKVPDALLKTTKKS